MRFPGRSSRSRTQVYAGAASALRADVVGPGYCVSRRLVRAYRRVVWVNRGFVAARAKGARHAAAGQVPARSRFVRSRAPAGMEPGMVHAGHRVVPADDYCASLDEMHRAAFGEFGRLCRPRRCIIDADAEPPNPGGLPQPARLTMVELRQPAPANTRITWYGLAPRDVACELRPRFGR